ncbi:unnamed protein product [Owenia fusiformis]|uniref:Uncharacterized protein n=1 Tax=Owenia fusiformis TaxID=6347 RepID=A0A8S4P4V0_OWEFU|nr:unnamed protein product [Owenia fusiformis]
MLEVKYSYSTTTRYASHINNAFTVLLVFLSTGLANGLAIKSTGAKHQYEGYMPSQYSRYDLLEGLCILSPDDPACESNILTLTNTLTDTMDRIEQLQETANQIETLRQHPIEWKTENNAKRYSAVPSSNYATSIKNVKKSRNSKRGQRKLVCPAWMSRIQCYGYVMIQLKRMGLTG